MDEMNEATTESRKEHSTNDECDQDSNIPSENDTETHQAKKRSKKIE